MPYAPSRVFAFLPSIGYSEMFLILVVGLLLYGRNLPEAGRNLGKAAAKLRRAWYDFKDQLDRDGDLREVKNSLRDTADELRRVADVPRAIGDPRRGLQNLAKEALSAPPDQGQSNEPKPPEPQAAAPKAEVQP